MALEYDLVIVGAGTGGYVAAIRASQLGMKTAIVERGKLGGTCLHEGCIPSKALLRSAEVYHTIRHAGDFGVDVSDYSLNFTAVQDRKEKIVDQLHKGVQHLIKKGKIDVYEGYGRIMGPSIFSPRAGTISVEHESEEENTMLVPKFVMIATGSRAKTLPGLPVDEDRILTSTGALVLREVPESITIVGGGVIGIEWASMLADFGSKVTVLEYLDRILPGEDADVSKEMLRAMKKKGVKVYTGAKVNGEDTVVHSDRVTLSYEHKGKTVTLDSERVLVSVGREANTEDLGLGNTEIETDRGFIQVNEHFQTAEEHIYAIGDVIGGLQLAHVASHEGIHAVEHMAALGPEPMQASLIPKCTYSAPEVASVGLTEEEALHQGYRVKTGMFSFKAIGKALVFGDTSGFAKFVTDENNNDLLGVHMIGPHVTELISEAALARVLDAAHWEVASTIHPHPSLSEIMGEAALAVEGNEIHGG